MITRRTAVVGFVGAATAGLGGCLDAGDSKDSAGSDGDADDERPDDAGDDAAGSPEGSYRFRAAPALETDDRSAVLSTDDDGVADLEPLYDVVVEVVETDAVAYQGLSEAEAESFRDLTADVESYPDGDPPGYYVEHDDDVVSVDLNAV